MNFNNVNKTRVFILISEVNSNSAKSECKPKINSAITISTYKNNNILSVESLFN